MRCRVKRPLPDTHKWLSVVALVAVDFIFAVEKATVPVKLGAQHNLYPRVVLSHPRHTIIRQCQIFDPPLAAMASDAYRIHHLII